MHPTVRVGGEEKERERRGEEGRGVREDEGKIDENKELTE